MPLDISSSTCRGSDPVRSCLSVHRESVAPFDRGVKSDGPHGTHSEHGSNSAISAVLRSGIVLTSLMYCVPRIALRDVMGQAGTSARLSLGIRACYYLRRPMSGPIGVLWRRNNAGIARGIARSPRTERHRA